MVCVRMVAAENFYNLVAMQTLSGIIVAYFIFQGIVPHFMLNRR